ncbi:ribonucleoside-diphosphate reductase, adenosylcobalamin-dependent [Candidatus Woesearchaeota archaeon]|nr:ribonucleoside-diphosphate reductase, adenosylcobalamin-dependent [Candidatus Woesearchaeota archaeon]
MPLLRSKASAQFSESALRLLDERYLARGGDGAIKETPDQMLLRVAETLAKADLNYDPDADVKATADKFYSAMANLDFLPSSPILMNAGLAGSLASSAVIPVPDEAAGIGHALLLARATHVAGSGTGFSFSTIRPKNAMVAGRPIAPGPVSVMAAFAAATASVRQAGRRQGSNMAALDITHPDVFDFMSAKQRVHAPNCSMAVCFPDSFLDSLSMNRMLPLKAADGKAHDHVPAVDLWRAFVEAAWRWGEPGALFIDRINEGRGNPAPSMGRIVTTDPCASQPLHLHDSAVLGSINLSRMVSDGSIDRRLLSRTVHAAVHLLDNAIDCSMYPERQMDELAKGNRRIGLGVMGFADMLAMLGVQYDSEKAVQLARDVMLFISSEADKASMALAVLRGPFPNFYRSIYHGGAHIRNATRTGIAPTGSISILADCSPGIEPHYNRATAPAHSRTALEMSLEWHVRMAAAFQEFTDAGVSKTVNLPHDATMEDVEKVFLLAFQLGCKGITVYRDGCRPDQVWKA